MSPYYTEESIKTVIESNDIVDIISEYVTLQRKGSTIKACCPFHQEKTPSFIISPEKQLYHCFGCGAGGNVVTFLMEIDNMSFIDAIEYLAQRANISLITDSHSIKEDNTRQLNKIYYNINRDSALFFHHQLMKSNEALNYLYKRNLSLKTIKKFGLGYSLNDWHALERYLQKKGHNIKHIEDVGLIINNNKNIYDRFRNRIMFPILNIKNDVIGFGGRKWEGDDPGPKYLNSPESPVFSKGKELFHMNIAKKAVKDAPILLVEGYMDVIGLSEKNIDTSVASLGTALTIEQIKLIEKYSKQCIICYDGDEAGQNATDKAINLLKNSSIETKVLELPTGVDPDEYIRKNGKESFLKLCTKSINWVDFKLMKFKMQSQLNNSEEKVKFLKNAINVLSQIDDSVKRDMYIKELSDELNIGSQIIRREYHKTVNSKKNVDEQKNNEYLEKDLVTGYEKIQRDMLSLLISDVSKYSDIINDLSKKYFTDKLCYKAFILLKEKVDTGNSIEPSNIIVYFDNKEDQLQISKIISNISTDINIKEVINKLKYYWTENELKKLNNQLDKAWMDNNSDAIRNITDCIIQLKKEREIMQTEI
jgi:DNA primase